LRARDAVAGCTPAAVATSRSVAGRSVWAIASYLSSSAPGPWRGKTPLLLRLLTVLTGRTRRQETRPAGAPLIAAGRTRALPGTGGGDDDDQGTGTAPVGHGGERGARPGDVEARQYPVPGAGGRRRAGCGRAGGQVVGVLGGQRGEQFGVHGGLLRVIA